MQEVLHAFGIDWKLIVIQVFNFAILIGVLWYFLYTPVLSLITKRQEKIKKGVEQAEAAEQALKEAGNEKQKILSEAQQAAEGIVARAKEHGDVKGKDILHAAEEKAQRIVDDANQKATEIQERAYKESEAEIARAAILAAEKIMVEKSG